MKWQIGLNPFEFRAGLKQHYSVARAFSGLNPFEFRAGLKRKHRLAPRYTAYGRGSSKTNGTRLSELGR